VDFATRVRAWRFARLYSEIVLSWKPFRIGHMYTYTFLLRMADTVTSHNIVLSSWGTLYNKNTRNLDFFSRMNEVNTSRVTIRRYLGATCAEQFYVLGCGAVYSGRNSSALSQKIALFIVTDVRTSNPLNYTSIHVLVTASNILESWLYAELSETIYWPQ
jgi:hypothetical protein